LAPQGLSRAIFMGRDISTQTPDGLLNRVFLQGRSFSSWQPLAVDPALLQRACKLAALGPTSMNCQPARFVVLGTPPARERLLPHLAPPNVDKTRTAPVTVIVAAAARFHEELPRLFPHKPEVREIFVRDERLAQETSVRNATLTGGYFICALRALGLDCGPMSGFHASGVDAEFFPSGEWKCQFLINIGYGQREGLHPRLPRLTWKEASITL
jgi:3-hydroxypropanoate dehydrogenase